MTELDREMIKNDLNTMRRRWAGWIEEDVARNALEYIYHLEDTIAQRDSLLAALGVTVPKEG